LDVTNLWLRGFLTSASADLRYRSHGEVLLLVSDADALLSLDLFTDTSNAAVGFICTMSDSIGCHNHAMHSTTTATT
jgi:hypothetical protein